VSGDSSDVLEEDTNEPCAVMTRPDVCAIPLSRNNTVMIVVVIVARVVGGFVGLAVVLVVRVGKGDGGGKCCNTPLICFCSTGMFSLTAGT